MIEYVPEEGSNYNPGDEFDDEESPKAEAPKAAAKAEAKPKARAKVETPAEEDDDIPF
jgi:hypothetical protein